MHRHNELPKTEYGWWRFDRYEIENNVIRPAPNSRLTWYDPWFDFQQVRNQTSGQPAYSELVRLVTALNADPATKGRFRGFSPESQSKILDWCKRHGLLGVLLSRWESATLSPRADRLHPTLRIQNRYIRGSGTDIEIRRTTGDLDQPRSGALIHLLNEYEIKNEPLGKTWYRFFPSVPKQQREVFAYPVPYSRRFWRLYAEPEIEFWHAAKLFAGIVEHFGPATKAIAGKPRKRSEALARKQAFHTLNVLRKPVSQVLVDAADRPRQEWVAPSLLASFAEMFVIDTVAGRRAQYCACCGYPYISEAYQARYCSPSCRLRQQKRNLRKHMKQARAWYLKGQTIDEISKRLDTTAEMVQGWVTRLDQGCEGKRS